MHLQADYEAGSGTFVKDAFICASLVGIKRIVPPTSEAELVRPLQLSIGGHLVTLPAALGLPSSHLPSN